MNCRQTAQQCVLLLGRSTNRSETWFLENRQPAEVTFGRLQLLQNAACGSTGLQCKDFLQISIDNFFLYFGQDLVIFFCCCKTYYCKILVAALKSASRVCRVTGNKLFLKLYFNLAWILGIIQIAAHPRKIKSTAISIITTFQLSLACACLPPVLNRLAASLFMQIGITLPLQIPYAC